MRLNSIKLSGFKSFVDPTSVNFPSSMSCIVGPNGCGKSNVIDAVRWVLGESSAKNLRSDSMTDVVFNGSSSRKPVSKASVELFFDNKDGRIGGEFSSYSEISVRRSLELDGQSNYYLNGTSCRKKDITDVFLGTGLGPRSYAIIEQGMISQLVSAKPEEMRGYIEEVAGISRYLERKKETQSRIKRTKENLSRLEDLREEISRLLFKLQRQAKAAEKYQLKVNKIAKYLKKKKSDFLFVTASENNAWLLNIRGRDTKYTPIPHSYILIDKEKNIKFFCDLKKISLSLRRSFKKIKFLDIKDCAKTLLGIQKKKFIIDSNSCSFLFKALISKKNKILNLQDPIYFFKAIKGKQEIENIKKAHIYDGVALTKYLFWLKKNFNKKNITEITASKKLLKFRKKNKKFKFLSFPTISGTGPNGAIIHYKATRKTNRKLRKGDIYLVDSGGQYEFGTTDVTRTICFNNQNKKIKDIFTNVLKGHIAVVNTDLNKKKTGRLIDIEARRFLKKNNQDYNHGTGHGVGFFLNVHEGPQAISKQNSVKIQSGMILSNEPGYYKQGKFGIRIENLIYANKIKNRLIFKNLTLAPIEKDLINFKLLTKEERDYIFKYHFEVYSKLSPLLNKKERKWLASFI